VVARRALDPSAKRGGRKRSVEPREIVNGLMYVLSTGCSGVMSQRPAAEEHAVCISTFGTWDGTLDRIHHALYVKCREDMDREASQRLASSIARA